MSNDIRDILSRLTALEGKITPTTVKKGLNPQQDSVPQMPALFKPKKISVLGSDTDPAHPAKGYAVGSNESTEPAANKLAEAMAEIEEDMLSKVKRDLTTYLDRLEQKMAGDDGRREKETPELDRLADKDSEDRALIIKAVDDVKDKNPAVAGKQDAHDNTDDVGEDNTEANELVHDVVDDQMESMPDLVVSHPVKTIECWPGKLFEIHGNEQQGFEIRHQGRSLPSRFKNLDDADMAVKLYKAHKDRNDPSADYIEER